MANTKINKNFVKSNMRSFADEELKTTIVCTSAGASGVIDTRSFGNSKNRKTYVSVSPNESVSFADTDTLTLVITTGNESTADDKTLYSETFTATSAIDFAIDAEMVGAVKDSDNSWLALTDIELPSTTDRYVKFTLSTEAGDGAEDKSFTCRLMAKSFI